MVRTVRTKETEDKYTEYKKHDHFKGKCVLCIEKGDKEFKYWKTLKALFPYDLIAETHDMVLPIRHATWEDLTKEELEELEVLKKEFLHDNYQFLMEATNKTKSIPAHFHLHLINLIDRD